MQHARSVIDAKKPMQSYRCNVLAAAVAAVLFMGAFAPGMARASLVFEIDGQTGEFSGSGGTFGGTFVATFDNLETDKVKLTLDATGMTDPSTLFIRQFYFNFNEANGISLATAVTMESATATTGTVGTVVFSSSDPASFMADGDGNFNFRLDFPTAGGTGRFNLGEVVEVILTATGLTFDNFDGLSVGGPADKTGFPVALRVQGLGEDGENSGFFTTNGGGGPGTVIPEPSTIAMALTALVPLGFTALRRLRRRPVVASE